MSLIKTCECLSSRAVVFLSFTWGNVWREKSFEMHSLLKREQQDIRELLRAERPENHSWDRTESPKALVIHARTSPHACTYVCDSPHCVPWKSVTLWAPQRLSDSQSPRCRKLPCSNRFLKLWLRQQESRRKVRINVTPHMSVTLLVCSADLTRLQLQTTLSWVFCSRKKSVRTIVSVLKA